MRIFRQQEQTERTIAQFQLCQWRQERTRELIDVSTRLESDDLSRQRIRQPEFFAIQRTEKTSLHLHGIDRACFARKRRAHGLCDLPMDLVSAISKNLLSSGKFINILLLSIFYSFLSCENLPILLSMAGAVEYYIVFMYFFP